MIFVEPASVGTPIAPIVEVIVVKKTKFVNRTRTVTKYIYTPPAQSQTSSTSSYNSYQLSTDSGRWSQTVQCESRGNWHIDHGIGPSVSGGLQISQRNWITYGGLKFASAPWMATPAQQIAIAEIVLQKQGPGAWPHCPAPS